MTQKSQIPLLAEFRLSILAGFAILALTLFACSGDKKPGSEKPSTAPNRSIKHIPYKDIKHWVGVGKDTATLIVQWNDNINPDGMAWGYLFDEDADDQNKGISMILAIAKTSMRFSALLYSTSSIDSSCHDAYCPLLGVAVGGFGYAFNKTARSKLLFNNNTSDTLRPDLNGLFITHEYEDFDKYTNALPKIDHWQSGWYNGYWSYWINNDYSGNFDKSEFNYSPVGASTRELVNHSADYWEYTSLPRSIKNFTPVGAPANDNSEAK
jgi:hypothetical protein